MAVAHQKSAVANNAVAGLAEARQEDEQPLLEERRNGTIEISRLGEVPKPLDELRRIRGRHEEIGYEPKAPGYFAVKRTQVGQSDGRQPVRIALTALRDLDNLLGQDFLYDRRLAFRVKGPTGDDIGLAQSPGRLGVESAIPENGYDQGHRATPDATHQARYGL